MSTYDRLIASCSSWDAFFDATSALPTRNQRGAAFERLTQLYLRTQPEYVSRLADVWLLSEVPASVCEELRLPQLDEGIDLIARTRNGDYWAIQSKFRKNKEQRLSRRKLSTFTSLAFHTCKGISLAVVAHTCAKPVKKHELIGLDRWLQITEDDWQRIRAATSGKTDRPKARDALPHQKVAIAAAQKHFVQDGASRGRLIMPCGTGKSLTGFWIAQALDARTILVAVPSLALVRQSLTDWTREYLAAGKRPEWLVVCSDESTGNLARDEFVGTTYDLGIDTHTDSEKIATFLAPSTDGTRIVFTTYQSGAKLIEGVKRAGVRFDLGIFDEAHKTVGVRSKAFAALLFDENVPISRRIFMTATERVLSGRNDDVLSMDDLSTYGARFHLLSFKEAIEDKLICDYRVLTVTISDERIKQLVEGNRLLNLDGDEMAAADASDLATGVALKRAVAEHDLKHAISFHRSIQRAEAFARQQDALNKVSGLGPEIENRHISGKKSAGERTDLLKRFASSERALLTNARCLTEGVDVKEIDCVLFADPKQSTVDIVQAAGRALRTYEGKKCGYILLPLVVPSGMSFEEFAESTEFRQVAKTITALSIQDERIAEEFRAIDRGERSSGQIITIEGDVPVGMRIDAAAFAENISTKVWERVGKANWRRFEDARAFARTLGLPGQREWWAFAASGKLPSDIPARPDQTYAEDGWQSIGDWLGTGTIHPKFRQFRPFEQARAYVRTLGLRSNRQWRAFVASGKLPSDIPTQPDRVYEEHGWQSFGDWLGTGTIAPQLREFRSFEQARAHVRSLRLRTQKEWHALVASGKLPRDIPGNPSKRYAEDGWQGMGDWLGTRNIRKRGFRSFEQARAYVRTLGLRSNRQWRALVASGKLPSDIPSNPDKAYAEDGWRGTVDWLGYELRRRGG